MSPIHALRHVFSSRRSGGRTARLRLWLAVTSLSCALLAPLALAASPVSALTVGPVQSVPGASPINGVACPTATVCEAVGDSPNSQGVVGAITNGIPGTAQVVPGAPSLNDVACPTATTCEAIGGAAGSGQSVAVTITSGVAGAVQMVPGSLDLSRVACPTSVTCLAVGRAFVNQSSVGALVTLTNGVPGAAQIVAGTVELDGIACSSATTCVAGGAGNLQSLQNDGVVVTITNGTPGAVQQVVGTRILAGVACPTASDCEAVGWSIDPVTSALTGAAVTIGNGVPGVYQPVPGSRLLDAVACSGAGQCVAVGDKSVNQSAVVPITGGVPGAAIGVPGVDHLYAVACPSATTCEAGGFEIVAGKGVVVALTHVTKANPTVTTAIVPTPPVAAGQPFQDSATLAGGDSPTGTITFQSFSDAACSTALSSPDTTSVGGNGTYLSQPITSGVGTIWLRAAYSGDANNDPATGACQPVQIVKASPTISSQASPGGLVGTPVSDHATLSGGASPTGKVSFSVFSDAACTTQVFSSTNDLAAGGATSASFIPTTPGTYYWTASYGGDANNNGATAACGAPNESVVITPFAPPPFTRTITGIFVGPLVVNAGDSVQVLGARVVGPVTVNPGGALSVSGSQISGAISANAPGFLSLCGTQVQGALPAPALAVSNATVPIRIGDPSGGCAGNQFTGGVNLTHNLAVTFAGDNVSQDLNANNDGPGNTTISANRIFGTLSCTGDNPTPTNGGHANVAAAKTGQCAAL